MILFFSESVHKNTKNEGSPTIMRFFMILISSLFMILIISFMIFPIFITIFGWWRLTDITGPTRDEPLTWDHSWWQSLEPPPPEFSNPFHKTPPSSFHWVSYPGVQHLRGSNLLTLVTNYWHIMALYGQIYWHDKHKTNYHDRGLAWFKKSPVPVKELPARIWESKKILGKISLLFYWHLLTFHPKSYFNWYFTNIFPPSGHFTDFYWLNWRTGHPAYTLCEYLPPPLNLNISFAPTRITKELFAVDRTNMIWSIVNIMLPCTYLTVRKDSG